MFRPCEYKHSTVCDLKRLGWEGPGNLLSVVQMMLSLPKETPKSYLCCVWELSQARASPGWAHHCSGWALRLPMPRGEMC